MRCLLLLLSLCFTFSCTPAGAGDAPVDTDRLTDLVVDLHLMEGLTGEIAVVLRDSMKEVYTNHIVADHGYRRAEFDSLMWIIRQEPEWIDALFQEVSAKIAVKEVELSRTPPQMKEESEK